MNIKHLGTGIEEVAWKIHTKPPMFERQYGFDSFCINLNYVDEEMKKVLPPTDNRLRPDQRYLENFDMANAALEKARLEEK
jgi:hypothetical protein